MRRCVLFFSAGMLAVFGTVLGAPAKTAALPKGRSVITNGAFDQSKTGPVGWMTRDSGGFGDFKLTPPLRGVGPSVLTVTCKKTCERPWYLELRQRVGDQLLKGERVFISFEYKVSKGYAFHFYWQKETQPWPKMLSLRLAEPVNTWNKVQVAVPVDEDLAAGASALTFHLAEELGSVQLRNIHVIAVSPRVDPKSLPSTVEPVFGGDFYDKDWRNAALTRIAQIRQSPVRVTVHDGTEPVSGAEVRLSQLDRPFSIGIEAKAPLLVRDGFIHSRLDLLNERLGEARVHLPAYRKKVLASGMFDTVTLEAALMWQEHDLWGKDLAKHAVRLARANGLTVHGHALLCPAFEFLPDPARYRQMEAKALSSRLLLHIRSMTQEYAGLVDRWEVLFGPLAYDEVYDAAGVDLLPSAFVAANQGSAETPLLLSDVRGLMEPTSNHISETVELVQWLELEKARVDGLVLDARLTQPYTAPQAMDERLQVVGRELAGMPVYIASLELDVAREAAQAHMLRDLLISFFSHEHVLGVSFANIWEAEAPKPSAALYRADMTAKPSGEMLEKLLDETWRTKAGLTTAERGEAWIRAFHGNYDVQVTVNGRTVKGRAELLPGGTDITVDLANETQPLATKPLTVKRVPDSVRVRSTKASWQTPLEEDKPELPEDLAPASPDVIPPMPAPAGAVVPEVKLGPLPEAPAAKLPGE